ncbi:ATP-dependent DNA ligase [Georgenia sp. TF02-10]|uniref:ATP-dependent DNA ligase n=1 Tax=Georgenia sp. TF02-10 TaxID=2917725 RepID=UPI001FA6AD15|nr:ATP-dependent DNA ligase [Georgenia sp. TF02-10]UNX53700.1 ATP-dependent DNA ligase [Georgenia sp. TF02-10]
MLLAQVVQTSAAVAATRSRLAKRDLLAATLRAAGPEEVAVVAEFLAGRPRQRRTGVGWRSLTDLPTPARAETLTPLGVDAELARIGALTGPGSQATRATAVRALFATATAPEQQFLAGLLLGELRQGALDSLLLDAIAAAAEVPLAAVRRAAMFSALSGPIAQAALTGGAQALTGFHLVVGRPVRPMLASAAPDVDAALAKITGAAGATAVADGGLADGGPMADGGTANGGPADGGPVADGAPPADDGGHDRPAAAAVAVDGKIDGIRIQVHRAGEQVTVFTRSLDDVTDRLPEVVDTVRDLAVNAVVLDGEAIALDAEGRPRAFQETGSRTMTRDAATAGAEVPLTAYFFDLLHLDGRDLLDAPASERFAALADVVPPSARVPRRVTADPAQVQDFFAEMLGRGHEGVVVKDLTAPYAAGRRGAAWVKVKPRHTLDLVVLAVEWGSGRRRGLLSNIHLGARDGEGFVMLGKTFKGMTDEMLAWQTERFLALETGREGHVVHVRPEQVVEVAFDGVQRSSRYPGGVALRFARVLRYRHDKSPTEADTLSIIRAYLPTTSTDNFNGSNSAP